MNLLCKTQAYLRHIALSVDSLSGMICSDELRGNAEMQYQIVITMLELEQATADFVQDIELDSVAFQSVIISKRRFMKANERVIRHLEKIQSQGYNFTKVVEALKLENYTLKKETELF